MGDDNKGLSLTPKLSFALGLVGGVLVICTIGFIIMLALFLGGNAPAKKTTAGPTAAAPTAAAPTAAPDTAPAGDLPPLTANDHVRGDKNAPVTIVEYSDFQCPYCGAFHPSMQRLMDEYDGQVNWVYRNFPLSFHPNATPAANAAECIAALGGNDAYWEFADGLFENQDSLGDALYASLAKQVGVNASDFQDCYTSRKYQAKITADQTGGAQAGVTGTPGSFIVGADGSTTLVPGAIPYEQLKAMVDQML